MKAVGHVHAVSGDMTIDAEEAIYHRKNPNDTCITATGNPTKYDGITEDDKPFSGISKKLKYTPKTGEVTLSDEAFVQQNGKSINETARLAGVSRMNRHGFNRHLRVI
ncbi:LptA/OstA family protein [Enterobacter chuandaensis]